MGLHAAHEEIVLLQQIAEKDMRQLGEMVTDLSRQKRDGEERSAKEIKELQMQLKDLKEQKSAAEERARLVEGMQLETKQWGGNGDKGLVERIADLEGKLEQSESDVAISQQRIAQLEAIVGFNSFSHPLSARFSGIFPPVPLVK